MDPIRLSDTPVALFTPDGFVLHVRCDPDRPELVELVVFHQDRPGVTMAILPRSANRIEIKVGR